MLTTNSKKRLSYLLKTAIIILAAVFIYHKVIDKRNLRDFESLLNKTDPAQAVTIMSIVVALMLVNWLLEAGKWKYLSRRLAPMSFWVCIQAVFCGLTWAIFTPNRLGEYGGRVMFLPQRRRIHGVFAMAVGSFAQNVITNVVGPSAIIWFAWHYLHLKLWIFLVSLICALSLMVLMVLFYFKIRLLVTMLDRFKALRKYHRFFEIMGRYTVRQLLGVLLYSLARYVVFSSQYWLVFYLLLPSIPYYTVLLFIIITMFIQSALPSLDLLDINVRNLTALALFAYVTDQKVAVIASVSSIWLINLIFPAILGSIFVFKLKFFDNDI